MCKTKNYPMSLKGSSKLKCIIPFQHTYDPWSLYNYQTSNKTLKIIDLKTKQPQPSIKKTIVLFQNKINNTKWPLKSGNQKRKEKSKSKYKFKKKTSVQNYRELSGLAQKLSRAFHRSSRVSGLGSSADSVEKEKTIAVLFWDYFPTRRFLRREEKRAYLQANREEKKKRGGGGGGRRRRRRASWWWWWFRVWCRKRSDPARARKLDLRLSNWLRFAA